jgi:hypothetical protein
MHKPTCTDNELDAEAAPCGGKIAGSPSTIIAAEQS